jgi:hypothetical protein
MGSQDSLQIQVKLQLCFLLIIGFLYTRRKSKTDSEFSFTLQFLPATYVLQACAKKL